MDANDGVFYMPISVFRQSMRSYSIAMYEESLQKHIKKGDGKSGKRREFFFKNPSRQDVIITFDKTPPRMVSKSCRDPPVNYNLYIYRDNKLLRHTVVPGNGAYQVVDLRNLEEGKYKVMVIEWRQ